MMYWKLFREMVERGFSRRRRGRLLGIAGLVAVLVVLAGFVVANHERGSGDYTKLKDTLVVPETKEKEDRPGGQEAIVLSRSASGDPTPEFLSVTLLPGRGMDVWQITANLPGRGEVKLLASGDSAETTGVTGGEADGGPGSAGTARGGPFAMVDDGSVFARPASNVDVNPMPDGGAVTATFASGDSGDRHSGTETTISALLGRRALELSVTVKNVQEAAVPVAIGWAPRFLILSGQRDKASLRVPATMREVTGQGDAATPTGALDPVKDTAYDFNVPGGTELGSHGLNDTFVHLSGAFEAHPAIELRDAAAKFGVRITALSPTIKAVHVFSPANGGFVTISPQMNYDYPSSRKWTAGENTGLVMLRPGQTVEWKVRVELFTVLPDLLKGSEPWWVSSGR